MVTENQHFRRYDKRNNMLCIVIARVFGKLFLTLFWLLIELFIKGLDDVGKFVDYITYLIELVFFVGIFALNV